MSVFKVIKLEKEAEYRKGLNRAKWELFVPGINSGVFTPASLYIGTKIIEYKSTFFGRFKKHISASGIALSKQEFDDLYNEMTKIKELRDNKTLNP